MAANMHVVYRYYTAKNEPAGLGPLPNICDILTRIEAPFNCTAQIRVTRSDFLEKLRPGDEIRGPFGNTDRHMRIDAIQYADNVGNCTIYCVQTDMWIYAHRIAFNYDLYSKLATVNLSPYEIWRKTTFQQKIYILYGFSIIPQYHFAEVNGVIETPNAFPEEVGDANRLPPLFGESLKDWKPAQMETSFYMHLSTVRDIMGSVVDLYKPAWDADDRIRFYPPRDCHLSRDAGMIRFISHGLSAVPTIGYGRGGQGWSDARLSKSPIPSGTDYERIYDISDEYDLTTLKGLTQQYLDKDQSEGEWWEVELLNDCGQKLWIGDTVIGDFLGTDELGNSRKAVITRITYDQTPDRIHTYLHLGKAPATVTDRLTALRLAARRDIELTWMKGLPIDEAASGSPITSAKEK